MKALQAQRQAGASINRLVLPGRTRKACTQAYYRSLDGRLEVIERHEQRAAQARAAAASVPQKAGRKPKQPEPQPIASPTAALCGVHGRRQDNLEVLRERADFHARIAERGLTAGFFGDPPPGRSALDKREGSLP
ncbi:hypothetical protein IC762_17650 [Bradyrhizobium genosp. L]|uniref:hypothetical protein n=1 Tax=Bradyrhizobium genosp. L TaxID=83637 RepID=UPI0018A2E3B5|nr:hypothetical protein [Bradyrhizobium genosp. L]QPF81651.1 hypothetical protein IC762_17650 [Bradyrhizobium genosp. L]